jgi:hypothetical protein
VIGEPFDPARFIFSHPMFPDSALNPVPEYVPPRMYTMSPGFTRVAAFLGVLKGAARESPLFVVSFPDVDT